MLYTTHASHCTGITINDESHSILILFLLIWSDVTGLNLVSLDISCNRIATLPAELRLMTNLVSLHLDNNPLTSPPASVSIFTHLLSRNLECPFATLTIFRILLCSFACVVWCMCSNFWTQWQRKKRNHVPMAMQPYVAMRLPNKMLSFRKYRKFGVNMSTLVTVLAMVLINDGHKNCHRMASQTKMAIQNGHRSHSTYARRSTNVTRRLAQPAVFPHINRKQRAIHRHRRYRLPATITWLPVPATTAVAMVTKCSNDQRYP